jgi:hypothetical protein
MQHSFKNQKVAQQTKVCQFITLANDAYSYCELKSLPNWQSTIGGRDWLTASFSRAFSGPHQYVAMQHICRRTHGGEYQQPLKESRLRDEAGILGTVTRYAPDELPSDWTAGTDEILPAANSQQ